MVCTTCASSLEFITCKCATHFVRPPTAALAAAFSIPVFDGLNLLGFKARRTLDTVHAVANTWPAVDIVFSVTWPAPCPYLQNSKSKLQVQIVVNFITIVTGKITSHSEAFHNTIVKKGYTI